MWVSTAIVCKLVFLRDEDKILTTPMLKAKCRINIVSILTSIQYTIN